MRVIMENVINESYPMVELDSDPESNDDESSDDDIGVAVHGTPDDDIGVAVHGTPQQMRRLQCRYMTGSSSDSNDDDDDFEKEMAAELCKKMQDIQKTNDGDGAASTDMTNDELLYDPLIDDDNQQWMNQQRHTYQPSHVLPSSEKAQRLPNSDAVLNCPGCMSLLCLDCQRHSIYKNQYRAMFVTNCSVDRTEQLTMKAPKVNRKRHSDGSTGSSMREPHTVYHPVHCGVCNTQVAVFDTDEVFHFFNVLSSYA